MRFACLFLCLSATLCPAQPEWTSLMPDAALSGWERVGDGLWHMLPEGIVVGQRERRTARHQSWLYSRKEYREFDLRFDYWLRAGENSGVSIRDTSRGHYSHGEQHDSKRTPSHIGYEIQILGAPSEKYGTGSLYLFESARGGRERFHDWNTMEIEVRDELIRVKLNGAVVMEHPGDPARPKQGPIGFQLHDPHTLLMLKNVEIREIAR
jgi:hypothetical protein